MRTHNLSKNTISILSLGCSILAASAAAPVAHDDVIASREGLVLELNYLHLNDTDSDGDNLTISSVGSPSNGTITNVGSNHYQYTPNVGYKGRDSFTYTISDGNGGTDTATVTISVNATLNAETVRDAILANVTSLQDPTQPGHMTAWGPSAFSVTNYSGSNETSPMVAAGSLGSGKVIAMPDHQWLNMNNYGADSSTGNLYKNGITWLAGSSDQSLKIVTMNVSASTWLAAEGYTNVVVSNTTNLASDLQGAAVFVTWLGSGANQSTIDTTGDFVRAGGGLFCCDYSPGYSWWWGKDKWDIPTNKLLREAGISFNRNNYSGGVQTINRADDEMTLEEIKTIFSNPSGHSQNEKDLAVGIMQNMLDSLHQDDVAYARLEEAFGSAVAGITPTEQNPVTDSFERQMLEIECSLLAKLDPADMTAHRAALSVAAAAPRVSGATFDLTSPPAGHSTKTIYTPYYAAPGELVTIDFPAALSSINLDVRVSHLRSGNGKSSFPVMPQQMINFDVTSTQVQVANPHGGLIQIIVPGSVTWSGTEQITVSGAVEAPYFKHGVTTDAAWVAGIRDRGTPFGVLDADEVTLVLDADLWLRTLGDPEAVIDEWNFFCGKVREFYAYDQGRQLPVHHDYYAAGGVSTYPQSYGRTSGLVDSLSLKASAYALTLHEYGHICDSGNIIFHEFGETSPNMGGKWMQETARKYSWKQELTVGRINNYLRLATDDLWNHYNHYAVDVKGTPFDLLSVEFGSQMIQDSVAAITAMSSGNFPDSQAKIDEWIRQTSNRTGFNMAAFFAAWQIPGSAAVQTELSGLPAWMPVERVEETLTVAQDNAVKFVDPSSNDFSYDGGLSLVSVGQPSNGTVTNNGDGTYTFTPNAGYTGSDSFTYTVSNTTGNQFTSSVPVTVVAAVSDPKLVSFDGYAHGSGWTTVSLEKTYSSMVVIAQPLVSGQAPPMVTRVRNASGSSFEVKLDRLDGSSTPVRYTGVRFLVVEEGVYNVANHGIKMEAVKFTSNSTDTSGSFVGTERSYAYTGYDHYFIPAVFGQVMSSNDANWSAFWYKAGNNSIVLGKHVGEDPNTARVAEDVGYIIIESGSYQIGEYQLQIGVAGYDGYAGFGNLSESGSSYVFDRFPTIHSAQTSSDLSVPWGGSNPGEDGFVGMQRTIGGNGISAYLAEDTLGDSETTTGSKSTSYLLSHYTGSNILPALDAATSLAGSQTLIDVIGNDINASGATVTVNQPTNGVVSVHGDGNLIYTPNNGYTGSDSFTYTVNDGSSSVTAPVLVEVIAANPVQAGLTADRFNGISGNSISDLTGNANYPDSPSTTTLWTSVDSGQNVGDSFGHRIYGVIVPPTTGDYTFWIASDDHSQLAISTDNHPANLATVANVSGWTGYKNWDQTGSQKSAVLQLEAGKAYAIEILHKEGGGGDHVAVAWEGPGFARTLLTTPALFTSGDNAPTVLAAPSNVSIDEGAGPVIVDLSGVFTDGDPGDTVTVAVHGNTNESLVQSTLNGANLTLNHIGNETGTVTITVRGTDRLNTLVTTSFDVTINDTNPDSDGDGLIDSWEVTHFGSVGAQDGAGDPDGDGLSNAGELAAGTNPNSSDSDSDGFADALEVAQGSNPANGGDTPSAVYADLHSYWPLNETAGAIAADYSGNGYAGAVTGASFVTGRHQNALSFDGVSHEMNAGSQAALLGTGDFSISLWAKTAVGFNATGTLIQQREAGGSGYLGEYMLNINGNGTVTFFIYNSGYQVNLTTAATVNDGNWHHFAVRRTGANVDVLIDGQVAATGSGTVQALLALEVSVGYDARDNNKHFNGDIDEVMVFSRSLSNADVNELGGSPSIAPATLAVDENSATGTSVGTLVASDPDNDGLSYAITSGNTGGVFTVDANGQIEVAGVIDFENISVYNLTVDVADAIGFIASAAVTVNINDVNEAPTALDASGGVAENTPAGAAIATVVASDVDAGDSLGYAITGGNGSGLFTIDTNGNVTTTTALDYEAASQHVLTVTVTDSGSLTDTATVTVNVSDENESPTASDASGSVAENTSAGAAIATVVASDVDAGDTLGYAITGGNGSGLFAIDSNGNVTTTTGLNYEAASQHVLTVTVTDSGSLTDTSTVTVSVTNVNEAPSASDTAGILAENGGAGVAVATVNASDPDAGDSLTYAITAGNGNGLFAIDSNGNVTTTGDLDYEAASNHGLTITVTDGGNLTDTAAVSVTVTNANEAPTAGDAAGSVAEDATIGTAVATVSASDPDAGDLLSYAITAGNTEGAFAIDSSGNITTATALDYETLDSYSLTVTVTDSGSLTDTATVSITVTDVVEITAPTVASGAASNITQTSADVGFSVTDDGGEASTVTIYYGETDGGAIAGNWDSSQPVGALSTGSYNTALSGLTEGTTYYYTVHASNSEGEAWGSSGSFTTEADSSPKLVRTTVTGVSSTSWTSVDLGQSYNSAVIIATPIYPNSSVAPVVTRIRNVSGSGFEVKIDRTDGLTGAVTCDVSIVAVEEGVYTVANDGVNMEAVKYTSTITGAKNAWTAENRSYQNSYTNPVIVGQVMSANDADWSAFWCHGSSRTAPPNASNLNVGKMVAEDPDKTRADETVGYIVIESGNGTINGVNYTAGLGSDIVRGTGNTSSGYTYSLTGLSTASAAAVSLAGLDGGDGGWAVLYGANPITSAQLTIACDEDQLSNSERNHTTEQCGYLVFE